GRPTSTWVGCQPNLGGSRGVGRAQVSRHDHRAGWPRWTSTRVGWNLNPGRLEPAGPQPGSVGPQPGSVGAQPGSVVGPTWVGRANGISRSKEEARGGLTVPRGRKVR